MKISKKFGAAAALAFAAAAFAQPSTFTDMGNHTGAESFTQAVTLLAGNDIQWFRIGLPVNSPADGYTDIWTSTSGLGDNMTDTEIGLYDSAGFMINNDDDGDDGLYSLLSFGQNAPARASRGNGAAPAGQDGTLSGGTYWLAVGRFNVNFLADSWNVNSTYTGADRTTQLNFVVQPAGAPIPPRATMTLSPSVGQIGDIFTAAVTVTPGANPPSTGITVRVDASSVNAGANVQLFDDGTNGDEFAGDSIYSRNLTVGAGTPGGTHPLTAAVSDAQGRNGNASANFRIPEGNDDCSGAVPALVGTTNWDNSSASFDGTTNCGFNLGKDIWYTFTPPADGDYTVDTCGQAFFDTVLTAYDSCGGTVLACNDDNCGLQSRITLNGLTQGNTIVLQLSSYNDNPGGAGSFTIAALGPTDPTGFGDVLPDPAFPGDVVQMTVTVTPGVRPISTGITVNGDLTAIGGGSSDAFYDDGTNGDDFAGDNVFSRLATIPTDFAGSSYTILFNIADAEGRSGNGSFNGAVTTPAQWTEMGNGGGDAGEVPATAQIPTGDGSLNSIGGQLDASDSDMYKIQICDVAGFTASTGSTDTTGDTQLWLFSEDGHGVQFNDDAFGLQSGFGSEFVTSTGIYYIAVSQYNRDAVDDASQLIWNNTPFAGVRAPDGPGAANIINGWDAGSTPGLSYRLDLTGACFAGGGCAADFNGDDVVDFFDYLDFVQAFADNDPSADFNADTVIDFFDYLDFVQAFAEGC